MKFRAFVFFICLMISGCTTVQPIAPAAPTGALLAPPTITVTLTPTSSPTLVFTPTQPVPPPTGKEIIFDGSGDKKFAGTAYGEGETVILLANMSIGGAQQWDPFVAAVDKQKFTTVTFDYRNINKIGQDLDSILGWLRAEGFDRLVCMGASLGSRACNTIAREPEVVGLISIAGPVHHASVAEATYPKLFISGALDRWAFEIQRGYEQAAEPKELVLFEDNPAHGTDLFSSADGEPFLILLINFVNSVAGP
jgi:hypothetical protein